MSSQKTKYPFVYRAVYPKEYIDGYIVKIVRKSGRLFKVFHLKEFNGSHKACMKAAATCAAQFDISHPKLSRRERSELPRRKSDKDLPSGVRRITRIFKGHQYRLIEFRWSPTQGVTKTTRFNISDKRSERQAIKLALAKRREVLQGL